MLLLATLFTLCVAPPNPITDDESDESVEKSYYYPFSKSDPYWKAFPPHIKNNLKKHDNMEHTLNSIRDLDFKLRQAWTVTDKPFNEH